ncbi:MAG: hypothetical protein EB117_14120 [Betaproteobacteria bacterium]|nr:hypothetical protein [Betaproteobacteria bacterium]
MELVMIRESAPGARGKMFAEFRVGGKTKQVRFGAPGYGDFPTYYRQDPAMAAKKQAAYLARHRVREDWSDPMAAGTLARYILWNKPTVEASVRDYKARFGFR